MEQIRYFKVNETEYLAFQQVLSEFVTICVSNDIKVFLIFGSLLGLARNIEIVPWEDDIDMAILEKDVEKLKISIEKCVSPGFW